MLRFNQSIQSGFKSLSVDNNENPNFKNYPAACNPTSASVLQRCTKNTASNRIEADKTHFHTKRKSMRWYNHVYDIHISRDGAGLVVHSAKTGTAKQ